MSGRVSAGDEGLPRFFRITSWSYLKYISCVALFPAAVILCSAAAQAQKPTPTPIRVPIEAGDATTPGFDPDPFHLSFPPNAVEPSNAPDTTEIVDAEACNSWTESGVRSPTVSVARLAVPGKASSEYQKACGALKDKKFQQAEEHVRKAIELYSEYPPAWVVLGQVLDAEHRRPEAQKACTQAMTFDPTYVAPYLCLAEFAATDDDWDQVQALSRSALALDPVNNAYSLYYDAAASFHFHDLVQAEKNAAAAVRLDMWHRIPQLHLLLAQVYAAKADLQAETAQLKEYLKQAPDSIQSAEAKSTLARLTASGSTIQK